MSDQREESRLEQLLGELEDLEKGRIALLNRVERMRSALLEAGERNTSVRATLELLCDHVSEIISDDESDYSNIELEIRDIEQALKDAGYESAGLGFESESLQAMLKETDDDLERLSAMLIERKVKRSRGH